MVHGRQPHILPTHLHPKASEVGTKGTNVKIMLACWTTRVESPRTVILATPASEAACTTNLFELVPLYMWYLLTGSAMTNLRFKP